MSTVPSVPLIHIRPKCRDQTITIFWNPPATDGGSPIQTYGVGLYDTGGGGIYFDGVNASTFSYTFTGLTNGQTYAARVLATNAIGNSDQAIYRFVQPGNKPSIPQNGTATSLIDSITVTWDAPSSNGGADIGWYVGKAISNNPSDTIVRQSAYSTDRSLTFFSLNPESSYTLHVYAVNDPGYSIPLLMPAAAPAGSIQFTYITGQGDGGNGPDSQYQYLTMSPGLSFVNNDFTIEFWIKPGPRGSFDDDHSEGAGVLGRSDANGLSVFFYHWDGLTVRTGPTVATAAGFPSTLTQGTWYYITVQRYTDPADSQGYITIWLNGTQISDNNFGSDNESACSSASTYLGYSPEDRKYISSGYLADIRVVNGTALYDHTSNISVPTEPFSNVTNTQLLLVMPSSIPSTDESAHQTITNTSAGGQDIATWSSSNPF